MQKKNSNNNLINNKNKIFNTVSIVDGDEVIDRNNDEYIYLDAVGGVITQPSEITTIKNRQSIDVLKNQLLGQFNSKTGKYEISNNIELELQQIVKVETSRVGNATFVESLSSFGGLGKLKFVVKTSVSEGEAHSELYIFERVNKMAKMVTNTQIQLVDEFKRTNENYTNFESLSFENYFRFAWQHFKIVKQNQSFYLNEDERFLQGWIVRRKLYLQNMDERLNASIELAESSLLLERVEILSGLGEYGYKVLGRFEELKNQATKILRGEELSARDQNEILEEAIETFRGKYVKEQEQFFDKQVKSVENYAQTIANLKEQNHKQVLNDIEMRMPTVIEIIKREDKRKLEEQSIKQAVEEASAQVQGQTKKTEEPVNDKKAEEPKKTSVEPEIKVNSDKKPAEVIKEQKKAEPVVKTQTEPEREKPKQETIDQPFSSGVTDYVTPYVPTPPTPKPSVKSVPPRVQPQEEVSAPNTKSNNEVKPPEVEVKKEQLIGILNREGNNISGLNVPGEKSLQSQRTGIDVLTEQTSEIPLRLNH